MTNDPISITSMDDIDLERHAVIEASAGTGKTYCIENVVVRLLCEKEVPLEQILLVTFTEKATGDLHSRIRENIVQALAEGRGRAGFLHEALENFDTGAIHTIHGFCQRTLKQYAFENGGNFNLEMVDDKQLYQTLLRQQQRRDWPRIYGDRLEPLLRLSGYPGSISDGVSSWEQRVLDLAERYRPEGGDVLIPAPSPDPDLDELDQRVRDALDRVTALMRIGDTGEEEEFVQAFSRFPMNSNTQGACSRWILEPLLNLVRDHQQKPAGMREFLDYIEVCKHYGRFGDQGFHVFVDAVWDNRLDDPDAALAPYREVATILQDLADSSQVFALRHQLAADTVLRLKQAARAHKEEHGLISFDDMLILMANTLDPERNPRAPQMLKQLRRRYRYALVDEFQDTDQVQWTIFQRIFLGSGEHRLFVIGDPKQAIYGFRGADVHAYLRARHTMLEAHGAKLYNLPLNWRSIPGLINGLNELCGSRQWFSPEGYVNFIPVGAPPEEKRRAKLISDHSRRAPLTIVNLDKRDRISTHARLWMARFVAEEIRSILAGRSFVFEENGRRRAVRASDICVLVRKSAEAEDIEQALSRCDIPYSFYKKGGLYESEEAKQLHYLFQAIAAPGDVQAIKKALLTKFFRVNPADLVGEFELPPQHPVRRLLHEWNELAEKRRWSELFQSIQDETSLFATENAHPGGERKITNYIQIMQDLTIAAIDRNLDFAGLIDIVRNYQDHSDLMPDNADMHRQESERPKVQIMTIHTSKGLEFPVVFLAGGFTQGRNADYWQFHDEHGHRVYDISQNPKWKEQFHAEQIEEDLRLYYVALTRAIYKLYLPMFRPDDRVSLAGPVAHFLYLSIQDVFENFSTEEVRHVDVRGNDMYAAEPIPVLEESAPPEAPEPKPEIPLVTRLTPEPLPSFASRARLVGSFSAFAHHSTVKKDAMSLLDKLNSFADEHGLKQDENLTLRELYRDESRSARLELPSGTETGTMLHEMFENIPFNAVRPMASAEDLLNGDTLDIIDEILAEHELAPPHPDADVLAWHGEVARLIYNTLRTPLIGDFCLADLGEDERIHEMEFFFPACRGNVVPEIAYRDGFLLGFIDLIFRHAGKYYILDWKSNYLETGYAPASLRDCMDEAGYHLQYKVYTVAVIKWLSRILPDFDPMRDFGGGFYLFLRGLDPEGQSDGIFFHELSGPDELEDYERELSDLFREGSA